MSSVCLKTFPLIEVSGGKQYCAEVPQTVYHSSRFSMFAVCLFISCEVSLKVLFVVCRSQARRQLNFGFLMMKCPRRLWPRSAVNLHVSLTNFSLPLGVSDLFLFIIFFNLKFQRKLCLCYVNYHIITVLVYTLISKCEDSFPDSSYCNSSSFIAPKMVFDLSPFSIQIQGIKLMVRWLLGVKNNQSKSGNSTLRMLTAILHSDGDLTEQGRMG